MSNARRITVTTLPSVALRWLLPRLSRFRERHDEIEVRVVADDRLLDLRAEGIDLALRFGRGPYPGYTVTPLMTDQVLPVCSPGFLGRYGAVETIDALLRLPLLHDSATEGDGSGSDWQSWLTHFGRPDASYDTGQRFSQAALAIEAAVLGLGIALARASLVADYLANRALVCPLNLAAPTAYAYFLLGLPETTERAKITLFRTWLQDEAAAMTAETGRQLGVSSSGSGRAEQAPG